MSRLRELIKELCPDGVEYKKLGEACEILDSQRKPVTKKDRTTGPYPYYGANGIQDYVDEFIFDGTFLLLGEDGSVVTEHGCPVVHWATGKIWVNNHAHILKEKEGLRLRFLFHYLQTVNIQHLVKGVPPKLNQKNLREILIPIPPPPIQNEIAKMLDDFTERTEDLITQLNAELELRKKQYNFYRDSLLNFVRADDQSFRQTALSIGKIGLLKQSVAVEWKTLGEIATDIFRGAGIRRDEVTEDGIPCVRYGEIYTKYGIWFDSCFSHTKKPLISVPKYFEYGDILFAITGENIDEIAKSTAYIGNEKCLAGGDIVVLKHEQNPKYLSYVLSTEMAQKQKSRGKVKSKVVHSSVPAIKEIKIPIPPLEVQAKIVSILDRFDTLCNDLSQGLPAEIAARKKQYEYYRDKLLTFRRKEESVRSGR